MLQGFLRTYADGDPQQTMDAAVVMPTILRPHLRQALLSVFRQRFSGRIHILLGIDTPAGDLAIIDEACASRPPNCTVQVLWPGFSTAARHGGLHPPGDGGILRCILTYLANSPYVAYLDDDNWWDPDHLRDMRLAMSEGEYAFALRWFVHPETLTPICVDVWESVGPGEGLFKQKFGGFVDPSCLMINKVACPRVAQEWNFPLSGDPKSADRSVFAHLSRTHQAHGTGRPTVFYTLNADDGMHRQRVQLMGQAAYDEAGRPA